MHRLLFLFAILAIVRPVLGQECATGSARAVLDGNNVEAAIYNNGSLFRSDSTNTYLVPKTGDAHAMFTMGLLIAGTVEDELRAASTKYGPYEFWPGPIPDGIDDCAAFDRIYKVTRSDLSRYESTGTASRDMLDWPVQLGAPVVDGDGVSGNYDLAAGDRPALIGEQTLWWVMNDAGGAHPQSRTEPIGIEVRVTAASISPPSFHTVSISTPDLDGALDHATFYRYRLTYRGDRPLDSVYVGFFVDPDLGDPEDDYAGSDTTLNLGYVYNGDDVDGTSRGYGGRPPAVGVAILEGLHIPTDGRDNDHDGETDEVGERLGMSAFVVPSNDPSPTGRPVNGLEFYRMMQALWRDGSPVTVGEGGFGGSRRTHFMYPAEPYHYWSEGNNSWQNTPSDRTFVLSMGPSSMAPGDEQEFAVVVLWARGADRIDSVGKLKAQTRLVQTAVDLGMLEAGPHWMPRAVANRDHPSGALRFGMGAAHPNPFAEAAIIPFELAAAADVRIMVLDALGREVTFLIDGRFAAGRHQARLDASQLPPGVYFVRMEAFSQSVTRPIIVMR